MTPHSVHTPSPAFEPTLEEALADPIVALVLRRDGLTVAEVTHTLQYERARLLRRRDLTAPRAQ